MSEIKFLYRYTKTCNSEELESDDNENNVRLVINTFNVVRYTPKGYWIEINKSGFVFEKWVSNNSRSRFAYPNLKEALDNFVSRGKRSIGIQNYQIRYTELALEKAKEMKNLLEQTENSNFILTEQDKSIFVESFLNPQPANEKLKRAQQNHSEFIDRN